MTVASKRTGSLAVLWRDVRAPRSAVTRTSCTVPKVVARRCLSRAAALLHTLDALSAYYRSGGPLVPCEPSSRKRPKLLLIGPTPPPFHGVAVATQALLEADWQERFEIVHLELADRRGIEHVDHPDLHDVWLFVRQWIELLGLLRRHRPHLVHIPLSQSTVGFLRDSLLAWPSLLAGSRLVLHLHGGNFRAWYERRGGLLKAYVRWVLRRAARVIVLGDSLQPLFQGLAPPERIAVVPNGIAWNGAPHGPGLAPRRRRHRVLYLGTLNGQKGALVLLEAIARLESDRHDIEFVFAGPWSNVDDEREAHLQIARHGLQSAVIFTGQVDAGAKRRQLESADLFVFPGLQQEGQPLVILEAMAAGLPILYTSRGCIADTVVNGEAGVEVALGDAADLAQKIARLLDDPQERQRLAATARDRYQAHYTRAHFVANMARVFVDATQSEASSSAIDGQTRAYFDRVAAQFQRNYRERQSFEERRTLWERLIRENLPRGENGALCLDMGCGDGRLGQTAAAQGIETVGIDQSNEMLALARSRARQQHLDGRTVYIHAGLPLPDQLVARYRGSAGLILCSSVLEYVEPYEQVLRQFSEMLRDKGRLIVSVPNAHSLYRWGEKLLGRFRLDQDSYLRYQRHVFYPEAFKACVSRLGYTAVHEEYSALPFRAVTSRLFGQRRGRLLSTLYVLVAQKT